MVEENPIAQEMRRIHTDKHSICFYN